MSNISKLAKQSVENEIILIEMAKYLLNQKKTIILLTFAVMLLVSVKVLLEPNQYSSTASLLPSGNINKVSQLSNMIGFGANNISDENSSELYPVILSSRLIQESILSRRYEFTDKNQNLSLTLPEYFETENPQQQRQSLSSITKIKTDPKTGSIHLAVETEYPGLSQAVLSAYLFELENYNLFKRNSKGQRNAEYLENQLRETKAELTTAENNLEAYRFANQNWLYSDDASIIKESRRHKRKVEILSQSYINLLGRYEVARQDANNDLPMVAVLDQSSLPTLKSGPRRTITVLLSGMAAFFMIIFVLLIKAVFHYKSKVENNIYYQSLEDDIDKTISKSSRIFTIIKKPYKEELVTPDI
ncbi:MAG: hypothetical protein GY865_12310 [candidate division Zixibacteria bacterium]|nr:hypothetical protein [candidate division Zixibacteria bacterium]